MKKLILLIILFTIGNIFAQTNYLVIEGSDGRKTYGNVSDIEKLTFTTTFNCGDKLIYGNDIYPTVLIGGKCWMAKNLNIGKRIDGSINQSSADPDIEKYCYNNLESNCDTYGGLYQWAEAVGYTNGATNTTSPSPAFSGNIQGICPNGWHIPSYSELEDFITAVSFDGNAIKALGQGTGSGAGTNTSGFSALFAGIGNGSGLFAGLGSDFLFWSATDYIDNYSFGIELYYSVSGVSFSGNPKNYALSVRCVKD
ncbi:MAG: hypothetical protein K8F60_11760 [Melioribacteraceae bacterium]|jgi:uncharacterized protein (TIGR02145 family)|nr:hypothetical protein [Melioribacteraceae bacterium]